MTDVTNKYIYMYIQFAHRFTVNVGLARPHPNKMLYLDSKLITCPFGTITYTLTNVVFASYMHCTVHPTVLYYQTNIPSYPDNTPMAR